MRDLFQVVFEQKKKEIEQAKQQIEQNAINAIKFHTGGIFVEPAPDTKVSSVPRNIIAALKIHGQTVLSNEFHSCF